MKPHSTGPVAKKCARTRKGGLRGRWDGGRIGQLVVNLLTNAVRYGSGQIVVDARAHDGQMTVVVGNEGDPIPESALPTLFDPLTRATSPDRSSMAAGAGRRAPSWGGGRPEATLAGSVIRAFRCRISTHEQPFDLSNRSRSVRRTFLLRIYRRRYVSRAAEAKRDDKVVKIAADYPIKPYK